MRLNYDCIRDVLLSLEELLSCKYSNGVFEFNFTDIEELHEKLSDKDYTIEDVLYSVINLKQAGLIEANFSNADDGIVDCCISDITYEGHEFVGKIRSDAVWNKIKKKLFSVGSFSLSVVSQIAISVITSLISSKMGLS